MFAKFLVVVLAAGSTGLGLLGLRHERLVLAHEGLDLHRRLQEKERDLWELRAEVARMSRPTVVEELARSLALDWQPIVDPLEAGPDAIYRAVPEPIELDDDRGVAREVEFRRAVNAPGAPGVRGGGRDDLPIDWPVFPVPASAPVPDATKDPAPAGGSGEAGPDAPAPAPSRRSRPRLPGEPGGGGASPVLADARRHSEATVR